ncbi:MAG: hypothetical protein ACP5JP_07605 [bacterium]
MDKKVMAIIISKDVYEWLREACVELKTDPPTFAGKLLEDIIKNRLHINTFELSRKKEVDKN